MKIRVRRLAAFTAALVAGIIFPAQSALAASSGWYSNYEEAVAAAKREGKPIFADFSTTWCSNCRLLEQRTFPHPTVAARLDNFVKVHIDAEQRADVAKRYNVQGYPTMVMLDPEGRIVSQKVGYVKPPELAGALDQAMHMLGPTLAQARANTQAAIETDRNPEMVRQVAMLAPPKPDANTTRQVARPEVSREAPKAAAPAPEKRELASLDAPKLPSREPQVTSLLRGKAMGGGNDEASGGRLIAQATSNSNSKTVEEIDELPRPILGAAGRDLPEPPAATKSSDATARKAVEDKPEPKATTKTQLASNTPKRDPLATIRKLQSFDSSSISEPKSEETAATAKAVTQEDVDRWIKDADTNLIAQQKKKARAMYGHVVEKDPENKFGKTDMAFIKMVSLMVDEDDDALRRMAYNKIKEFEARFPSSPHKDYYTLIRATLAADLGETNSAHKLLEDFTERFPKSKYQKLAYETWKSLPPVKKETASTATGTNNTSNRNR